MKIEAGIFDLGRVVVHSDDKILLADIRDTLGVSEAQIKQVARDIGDLIGTGQITEEEYIRQLMQKSDKKGPHAKDLLLRTFKRDFKFL